VLSGSGGAGGGECAVESAIVEFCAMTIERSATWSAPAGVPRSSLSHSE
jgi:hypothetical protein